MRCECIAHCITKRTICCGSKHVKYFLMLKISQIVDGKKISEAINLCIWTHIWNCPLGIAWCKAILGIVLPNTVILIKKCKLPFLSRPWMHNFCCRCQFSSLLTQWEEWEICIELSELLDVFARTSLSHRLARPQAKSKQARSQSKHEWMNEFITQIP